MYPLVEDMSQISELHISGQMDAQPSGKRKIWCQETLCHLSQGTGLYLASWPCLCSAVLRHPPPPCLSTTWHRHDQLAKYHPASWLRWRNVSWHQVSRFPEGWASIAQKFEVQIDSFWRIQFMKIMEFELKWVHMVRYELILKLDRD